MSNSFQSSHFLGWLHWDPSREAFVIPFFDHPVYWYGLLFVLGFILGYFIINPVFSRLLNQIRQISQLDVVNWSNLLKDLQSNSSPMMTQIFTNFPKTLQQEILKNSILTNESKQKIIEGFNKFLQSSSTTREQLQAAFPTALATSKQTAYLLTDRLCWFIVIGTIIGARLGEVFFYEWPYFSENPLEIFKVWRGGLASHGGVIGLMFSLYLYSRYIQKWIPQLTSLRLFDSISIPATLTVCFIRLGNFMNQEIVGTPTTLPWGVLFNHPAEHVSAVPRHPVQLYEAGAYFIIFMILWRLWKNRLLENRPGALTGVTLICAFGSRFILEFWKATQESFIHYSFLEAGQILSIPFIMAGVYLVMRQYIVKTKFASELYFYH